MLSRIACRRVLLVLAVATPVLMSAPFASETTPAELRFELLAASYRSVAEIRPTLVNSGARSLFLTRTYPLAGASLERWDDVLGEWQSGTAAMGCGTAADPDKPLEIKPGNRYTTFVWDGPIERRPEGLVFALGLASRPLRGRYRLVFKYATSPWTVAIRPPEILTVFSSPFELSGDAEDGTPGK